MRRGLRLQALGNELIKLCGARSVHPIGSDFFREMTGDPPAGINHIAFQVQDLEKEVKALEKKGIHLGYFTKDGIFDTGKTKIAYLDPDDTDGFQFLRSRDAFRLKSHAAAMQYPDMAVPNMGAIDIVQDSGSRSIADSGFLGQPQRRAR